MEGMENWFCLLKNFQDFTGSMGILGESGIGTNDPALYLKKEEKILSLAREKKAKPFQKDRVLESVKPQWEKTLATFSKKVGKEMHEKFQELADEKGVDAACEWYVGEFPHINGLKIRKEADGNVARLLESCGKKAPVHLLSIFIPGCKAEVYQMGTGIRLTRRYDRGRWKFRSEKGNGVWLSDFESMAAELFLRNYVVEHVKMMREESGIVEKFLERREVGRILQMIGEADLASKLTEEALRSKRLTYYCLPEDIYAEYEEVYRLLMDGEDFQGIAAGLSDLWLNEMLLIFRDEYLRKKEEEAKERELSGDYAKSFMTKKNIPDKYLRAMARSGFNDYFGYVEFDEDCDLALFPELYWEYKALAETVGIPAYRDVSLRFRKLGNHHATGLYYPSLACLCVDLRHPSSMTHEVGHMIDYHCDHISEKVAFMKVADCYSELLQKYSERTEDQKIKNQLNGKGKYNLSYYLQTTEIFARCFEMYLVRTMKVDNSLCKPTFGFAYPDDLELDRNCREFFNALLADLKGDKENEESRRNIQEGSVLLTASGEL